MVPKILHSVFPAMLLGWMLAATAAQAAGAGSPARAIPYHGRLDLDGVAVSSTLPMQFRLYDDLVAGSVLHTQDISVAVVGGLFAVVLGTDPANPLPESVFAAKELFLEIDVNGTALAGRQQLYAGPQAVGAYEFRVSNKITAPGRLDISTESDDLHLRPMGTTIVSNDAGATGNLEVRGGVSAGSAQVSGALSAGSASIPTLGVSGTATVGTAGITTLNTTGTATIGTLNVTGQSGIGYTVNDCVVHAHSGLTTPRKCPCPANTKVIGGGVICDSGFITWNLPTGGTWDGWEGNCHTNNDHVNTGQIGWVRAICARVRP